MLTKVTLVALALLLGASGAAFARGGGHDGGTHAGAKTSHNTQLPLCTATRTTNCRHQ
jgi:hypothetical protein